MENWNKTSWFRLSPSRYLGVINRIPDQSARGDVLLIAFHMLEEGGMADDDAEISWVTGLTLERVAALRPYLDRLKDRQRGDGRLLFDFVLDTITERQEFADKKAKAGQSGGKSAKAVQSSAKQCKANASSDEANASQSINHVVIDKSITTAEAASAPSAKPKRPPDARKDHPAITIIRSVAHTFPPKELWDDFISLLGDSPDRAKLEACRKEWMRLGYKPTNWSWVTDWYVTGIPERKFGNGAASGIPPPEPRNSPKVTAPPEWRQSRLRDKGET